LVTLEYLANLVDGKLIGQPDLVISGVSEIQSGKVGTISFLANSKYKKYLSSTEASALVVSDSSLLCDGNGIEVKNPQLAFSKILSEFCPKLVVEKGIHHTATIDKSANIGKNVTIGANAVIEAKTSIGNGTKVGSNSLISCNTVIGNNCDIHSNVTIYQNCQLRDRVIIFSGSVIGSDGFGFVTENDTHIKTPQIGKVIIGSDVEIGANCTIDRATIGETIIGNMTKMDNLVHIAHNVKIGRGCLFAAGTMIAGSSIVEDFCIFAGQSGVVPHVKIGARSIIASQSGVTKSLKGGELYSGMPARKIREQHKKDAILSTISSMKIRLNKLEEIILKNESTA